jgi:hypothetical protein
MRYTIRRLRRKIPEAKIVLGCWMAEGDAAALADATKADAVAVTLREALAFCVEQAQSTPIDSVIDTGRAAVTA